MADLRTRVRRLLRDHFEGARIQLDPPSPGDKIMGNVVWSRFEGKDQLDRQLEVRGVLRSGLEGDEVTRVGLIITVTPEEMAVLREA